MKNKTMLRFDIFISAFFIVSCNNTISPVNFNPDQRPGDTLYYRFSEGKTDINDSCLNIANSFHKKFDIYISDYFVVLDSLAIDLNSDDVLDRVFVVSPLSLEAKVDDKCQGDDTLVKRLLVEVILSNGKGSIRQIHSNLISDVGGVLSPYNGIFKTEDGFKIVHEAGAKYIWQYSNRYSVTDGFLALVETHKKCSFNDKEKNVTYRYNNIPASKVNIQDTLAHQCNCYEYWEELEKLESQ